MTGTRRRRRRWGRWLILGPLLLVAAVALWGVLDAFGGLGSETAWNHRWRSADGTTIGGYLIRPAEARRFAPRPATGTTVRVEPSRDGRLPAVLLLHEWWGLRRDTLAMAEQLAADGYVVLAPDALRGHVAVSVPGALVQMAVIPQEQIAADLDSALDDLRSQSGVDPRRIAVVGFCFGGTQAMLLGTRTPDLAATGIFYGGGPITDPHAIGSLAVGGPLLGIYGSEDPTIPVEDARRLGTILVEAGRSAEIEIYDGVGHAFVDPTSIRTPGPAAAAWDRMRLFLADALAVGR